MLRQNDKFYAKCAQLQEKVGVLQTADFQSFKSKRAQNETQYQARKNLY